MCSWLRRSGAATRRAHQLELVVVDICLAELEVLVAGGVARHVAQVRVHRPAAGAPACMVNGVMKIVVA